MEALSWRAGCGQDSNNLSEAAQYCADSVAGRVARFRVHSARQRSFDGPWAVLRRVGTEDLARPKASSTRIRDSVWPTGIWGAGGI